MLSAVQIANVLLESGEFDPSELASEVQMYPAIESWEGIDRLHVTLEKGRIIVQAGRNPKNYRERYWFEITLKVPWQGIINQPKVAYFRTNHLGKGKQRAVAEVRRLMQNVLPNLLLGVDLYQKTYEQLDDVTQAAWSEYLMAHPEFESLPTEFDKQTPETHAKWMAILNQFLQQYRPQ